MHSRTIMLFVSFIFSSKIRNDSLAVNFNKGILTRKEVIDALNNKEENKHIKEWLDTIGLRLEDIKVLYKNDPMPKEGIRYAEVQQHILIITPYTDSITELRIDVKEAEHKLQEAKDKLDKKIACLRSAEEKQGIHVCLAGYEGIEDVCSPT